MKSIKNHASFIANADGLMYYYDIFSKGFEMFGYLLPRKQDLTVGDYNLYKTIYCSLCRELQKNFGLAAKLLVNYDFVFLSLIGIAVADKELVFLRKRCTSNPFRRQVFVDDCEAVRFSAGCLVLSVMYKISDDIKDEKFFKRSISFIIKMFLRSPYRKARRMYSYIDEELSRNMLRQADVENSGKTNVDLAADATLRCMSVICGSLAGNEDEQRILNTLGGLFGRFIYLADAGDDLKEDMLKNRFNPLIHEFNLTAPDTGEFEQIISDVKSRLMLIRGEIAACYNLLDIKRYSSILDNIIFLGLPDAAQAVGTKKRKPSAAEFNESPP